MRDVLTVHFTTGEPVPASQWDRLREAFRRQRSLARGEDGDVFAEVRSDAATRTAASVVHQPAHVGYLFGRAILGGVGGDEDDAGASGGFTKSLRIQLRIDLEAPDFLDYPAPRSVSDDGYLQRAADTLVRASRAFRRAAQAAEAAEQPSEAEALSKTAGALGRDLLTAYQRMRVPDLLAAVGGEAPAGLLADIFTNTALSPPLVRLLRIFLHPMMATTLAHCVSRITDGGLANLCATTIAGVVAGACSDGTRAFKGDRVLGEREGLCYAAGIAVAIGRAQPEGAGTVLEEEPPRMAGAPSNLLLPPDMWRLEGGTWSSLSEEDCRRVLAAARLAAEAAMEEEIAGPGRWVEDKESIEAFTPVRHSDAVLLLRLAFKPRMAQLRAALLPAPPPSRKRGGVVGGRSGAAAGSSRGGSAGEDPMAQIKDVPHLWEVLVNVREYAPAPIPHFLPHTPGTHSPTPTPPLPSSVRRARA